MEYDLSFSPSSFNDAGSFRLFELPPDLAKFVESALGGANPLSLTIKGNTDDDAVLCTEDKTYALRSVVLSNTVLVVTGADTASDPQDIIIRDQLSEIIELVPSVPKLHKLSGLLKGMEYDEGSVDGPSGCAEDGRPAKRKKITYQDAQTEIQASDAELARGIREGRILDLHGQLRPILPAYLRTVLELLLNYLVSLSLPHDAAPVEELVAALVDEHEVPRQVAIQVMSWFGELHSGKWSLDMNAVAKEIGLGILREHKDDPISESEFIAKWRASVGDTFESVVSLSLLSGNYIVTHSLTSELAERVLTYFPASALPVDPAARFADLFLTRSRWKEDEIVPFLTDIAIGAKERDKLLLKFARATTDTEGVWYTARGQSNA